MQLEHYWRGVMENRLAGRADSFRGAGAGVTTRDLHMQPVDPIYRESAPRRCRPLAPCRGDLSTQWHCIRVIHQAIDQGSVPYGVYACISTPALTVSAMPAALVH